MHEERIYVLGVSVTLFEDHMVDSWKLWKDLGMKEADCPLPNRVSWWNGFCHRSKSVCPLDIVIKELYRQGYKNFSSELESRF